METFDADEAARLFGADGGLVVEVTGIEQHETEYRRETGRKS